jgi:branched-chain amino acid transport system permease protein
MMRHHVPFILALLMAGFVTAAFGLLLGIPSLRLEGPYLAIATLGFGMAVIQILGHWSYVGGHMGISTPRISIGPWILKGDRHLYYLIMPLTVIMTVAGRNLIRTKVGRAFIAIRDSGLAASTMGINLTYYKTLAFAISAFYTGIAGGLMAFVLGFINPGGFTLTLSITFLAMIVVGGLGSISGSILGAILLTLVQLKLNAIQDVVFIGPFLTKISEKWFTIGGLPNIQNILIGLLMIGIILFEPLGLYGIWQRIRRFWQTWPF